VDENQGALQGIEESFVGFEGAPDSVMPVVGLEIVGGNNNVDLHYMLQEKGKVIVKGSFHHRLELVAVGVFDLFVAQVYFDLVSPVGREGDHQKVVEGLALSQCRVELQNEDDLLSIRFFEHKSLRDIVVHHLIVVGVSMHFEEISVEVKGVLSPRDHKRHVFDVGHSISREFSNVSFFDNLLLQDLGSRSYWLLVLLVFISHLLILLFVVGHVEPHFTDDVTFLFVFRLLEL
jgi:hypothetical protein